ETGEADIGHHADDFEFTELAVEVHVELEMFTDGIAIGPEEAGGAFADDRQGRAAPVLDGCEIAPVEERDSEGGEVAGRSIAGKRAAARGIGVNGRRPRARHGRAADGYVAKLGQRVQLVVKALLEGRGFFRVRTE